jgi:hypothetical protein
METAALILLIVVSSVLAIFLVVAIVLGVVLVKLINKLKYLVEQAEKAVDSVTTAGEMLKNASGPLAVVKMLRNIVKHYAKK